MGTAIFIAEPRYSSENKFTEKMQAEFLLEKLEAVAPGQFVIGESNRGWRKGVVVCPKGTSDIMIYMSNDSRSVVYRSLNSVEVQWGDGWGLQQALKKLKKRSSWKTDMDPHNGSFNAKAVADRALRGVKMLELARDLRAKEQQALKQQTQTIKAGIRDLMADLAPFRSLIETATEDEYKDVHHINIKLKNGFCIEFSVNPEGHRTITDLDAPEGLNKDKQMALVNWLASFSH